MEPLTPSRRGAFDLPKPETGLAEWTTKIKALQRQVDADEEAEQKRLEEEIAAARRARLRRSRGAGYGGDSMDLSTSPSGIGIPSYKLSESLSTEVLNLPLDRQSGREDSLKKLTASPSSSNIDTSSITHGILPRSGQFPAAQPLPSRRPEPVSLASFIGGRATGPRLNRHAPQQDAHDPTQFEQRTITAPHPVFGKGGVAMPGMVIKAGTSVRDAVKASEAVERYQPRLAKRTSTPSFAKHGEETLSPRPVSPQESGQRDRTISTPSAASARCLQQAQPRPISPQKSGTRERTLSTPGPAPSTPKSSDNFSSRPTFSRPNVEAGILKAEQRSASPTKDRRSTPSRSSTPSRGTSERPTTPRQPPPIVNIPASPGKSSITTPSLARAILPGPRPSLQAPFIPNNSVPSPAFQKSPPPKDLTPSISRLQGRGFVQNMVRASTQLENASKSTPSSPASRPSSGRKSSVLDRWQPNVSPSPPTPAPISRHTSPVRKAYSELPTRSDPPQQHTPTPALATPSPSPSKTLKPKTSHPHLHPDPLSPPEPLSPRRAKLAEKMLPPEGGPGFGSATTMVVYKPRTPEPMVENPPSSAMDELGVRRDTGPGSDGSGRPRLSVPSELPGPSGKPLNHPTKDRARKPKKNSGGLLLQAKLTPELARDFGSTRENTPSFPQSLQLPRTPSPKLGDGTPSRLPSLPNKNDIFVSTMRPTEKESAFRVVQITQKWGTNAPIEARQLGLSLQSETQGFQPEIKPKPDPNLIRRALPGMANSDSLHAPPSVLKSKSPSPESTLQVFDDSKHIGSSNVSPSGSSGYTGSPSSTEGQGKSPSASKSDRPSRSPSSPKHTRIPSTGNRALVMDIAQALNDHNASIANGSAQIKEEVHSSVAESIPETALKARASPSLERRRSSYDRFSAVSVMPPLKEEATPNGTPVGTFTRMLDTIQLGMKPPESGIHTREMQQDNIIHFDFADTPLPSVDISRLLQSQKTIPLSSPDTKTISVDVFSINGSSYSAVARDTDIFYDSELLVIVHRYKSISSGLVSTQFWIWYGKKCISGEKEERKVQELAKRYNTSPRVVHQNSEPPPLVHLIGGSLIVRQGTRSHWSPDNTAMYSIRNLGGVTFIDEHDLGVKNLCSAFSYCLTILDTVYVWHGCGSTDTERRAAVKYASRICNYGADATQLFEGENDQDELFWMALGDEEFAKADYWRWRRQASDVDPRIWRVDATVDPAIVAVASLREESMLERSIYIIDCIWELFVQVGPAARGDRANIKLALSAAKRFSEVSASSRPFMPTVHVLVLPSKLPLDLRLNLRGLDDFEVNNGEVPDHMNLLSSAQAENHLRQHAWERLALRDQTMLPLGVSASDTQ